jgi:hypothetical protein
MRLEIFARGEDICFEQLGAFAELSVFGLAIFLR